LQNFCEIARATGSVHCYRDRFETPPQRDQNAALPVGLMAAN